MEVTIIGITGRARSGKSTAANLICDNIDTREGYSSERLTFAAPLKEMLYRMNPIVGAEQTVIPGRKYETRVIEWRVADLLKFDNLEADDLIKETFPEYRRLLQHLGTDIVRGVEADYWVINMVDRIMAYVVSAQRDEVSHLVVVVPDVRFRNEAELVTGLDDFLGEMLTRSDIHGDTEINYHLLEVLRPSLPGSDSHASERGVGMSPDATIFNTGTLADFEKKVDNMMTLWIGE